MPRLLSSCIYFILFFIRLIIKNQVSLSKKSDDRNLYVANTVTLPTSILNNNLTKQKTLKLLNTKMLPVIPWTAYEIFFLLFDFFLTSYFKRSNSTVQY
jgi:hypothetical protein